MMMTTNTKRGRNESEWWWKWEYNEHIMYGQLHSLIDGREILCFCCFCVPVDWWVTVVSVLDNRDWWWWWWCYRYRYYHRVIVYRCRRWKKLLRCSYSWVVHENQSTLKTSPTSVVVHFVRVKISRILCKWRNRTRLKKSRRKKYRNKPYVWKFHQFVENYVTVGKTVVRVLQINNSWVVVVVVVVLALPVLQCSSYMEYARFVFNRAHAYACRIS